MPNRNAKPRRNSAPKGKRASGKKTTEKKNPIRRRLSAEERRQRIVATAAEFFAMHGFDASTRDLATRLDVTQALLYRYFPSKSDLIDCVFETEFAERWNPDWENLLRDRSQPFEDRLIEFYTAYSARSTKISTRLWMRANLSGLNFATRYSGLLTSRILRPIIEELREVAGLSTSSDRPFLRGERELVMALHGSVIFLSIRRNIYDTPNLDDRATIISLQVRTFLPGAIKAIRSLHDAVPDTDLAAPLPTNG